MGNGPSNFPAAVALPSPAADRRDTLVFGLFTALGVAVLALTGSIWLLALLLVGPVTWLTARTMSATYETMLLAASQPAGPACPRCAVPVAGRGGWCAPCAETLAAGAAAPAPAVERLVTAIEQRDWEAAEACLAPRPAIVLPGGLKPRWKARRLVRSLSRPSPLAAAPRYRVLGSTCDPADPAVAWLTTHVVVDWRVRRALAFTTATQLTVGPDGLIDGVTLLPGVRDDGPGA